MAKMHVNITISPNFEAQVTLPVSKSVVNRELLINAQWSLAKSTLKEGKTERQISSESEPPPLQGGLRGAPRGDRGGAPFNEPDDIAAMRRGLAAHDGDTVDLHGAGTALRFLTAYWATREGCTVTLTGNDRLCQRPIAPLVDALRQLGADIDYVHTQGFAPLRITGRRLHAGRLKLGGGVSSQFVSALLMIAPTIGGLELELKGDIVSRPYIDMTLALMERHGVTAHWHGQMITVPAGDYLPAPAVDEGDWSAAAFWLALQALLPQARITLHGLRPDSVQGDRRILTILEQMGMQAHWHDDGSLTADMGLADCCCCSTFADLTGTPDLAPVLVAMLCLMGRPFRITGLRTLRHKESDRLEALRQELRKVGYVITIEGDDAVTWHFATCEPQEHPVIDPHDDHRIAMAMALAAVRHPGLVIANAHCVDKSYPGLWDYFNR